MIRSNSKNSGGEKKLNTCTSAFFAIGALSLVGLLNFITMPKAGAASAPTKADSHGELHAPARLRPIPTSSPWIKSARPMRICSARTTLKNVPSMKNSGKSYFRSASRSLLEANAKTIDHRHAAPLSRQRDLAVHRSDTTSISLSTWPLTPAQF